MAQDSKIEWTNHTANLWWGCTEVHEGCDNCYARVFANRYGVKWGNSESRKAIAGVWGNLLSMQAKAHAANEIHRVFVGSMMDIFEKPMPVVDKDGNAIDGTTDDLRQRFFREIVPNCPNLDFLLLTKRPSNINKFIPESWKANPPKNVMFGTSIVNHETLKTLGRQLQQVNGRKFFSIEPQLAVIAPTDEQLAGIDWVIQGGESGHGKRPFDINWIFPLRNACEANGVAYFFKQIDKVQPIPDWALVRQFPNQ